MRFDSNPVPGDGAPGNESPALKELIGCSPSFTAVTQLISTVAKTDVTVLVRGETGTGKELCARAIHHLSPRANGPFIVENCGRLPQELISNEFFGHETGAYTGATHSSKGFIGQARGGTLVLDEIDSMPLQGQAALLRFLQDKRYQPIGAEQSRDSDVRIVAVTNVDLHGEVEKGRFRRDLFYRIKVFEVVLPPLRQRTSDVEVLTAHFIKKYARKFGKPAPELTADCLSRLQGHDWPGNVRELEDAILQAVLLCSSQILVPRDLKLPEPKGSNHGLTSIHFRDAKAIAMKAFELDYLSRAMSAAGGNISLAARTADMDPGTLWHLLEKHQMLPRDAKPDHDASKG